MNVTNETVYLLLKRIRRFKKISLKKERNCTGLLNQFNQFTYYKDSRVLHLAFNSTTSCHTLILFHY